jgi:outer membrane protein
MKTFRIKVDTILLLVPLIVFSTFAHAETFTLNEALGIAYETNPQLNAQRAALRASDEEVAKALAGWRPTIAANGSYGAEQGEYHSVPGPQSGTNPRGATVTLTQPLLNGTAFANTRRAKFLVQAGRGQLTATEETVLLNAVTAYMDVVRNQDVVELEQNYGQALRGLRQAVADRFRIGELSRTDVAQTEARLSGALADLTNSQSQLAASRATFERVIGRPPESLEQAPAFPIVPGSYEMALDIALRNNPTLIAAREQATASDYAVDAAVGALLPSLSLQGQYQRSVDQVAAGIKTNALSIIAQLTIPLYQGGADHAAVRETKQQRSQAVLNIADAERQVREQLRTAQEALRSSQTALRLNQDQVEANEIAFEGVQQETRVGARTTLDVLNAELELLNARVAFVSSRRNMYVAAYQLLFGTGGLTAAALSLPVKFYDPQEHYNLDAARWFGLGD